MSPVVSDGDVGCSGGRDKGLMKCLLFWSICCGPGTSCTVVPKATLPRMHDGPRCAGGKPRLRWLEPQGQSKDFPSPSSWRSREQERPAAAISVALKCLLSWTHTFPPTLTGSHLRSRNGLWTWQEAAGSVGGSQLLRFQVCFDGTKGTQRAEAHATTKVPPPLGFAWFTQCPVFSRQQTKLAVENLKEEPGEEDRKEKAT